MSTDYFRSALIAHDLGLLKKAADDCRRVLSRDRFHADALHLLGMILVKEHSQQGAEILFRQALAIREDAEFCCSLGNLLRDARHWQEAEALYRRALALKPDSSSTHLQLGILLLNAQRFEEAEAHCRRALELKPNFAWVHMVLGNVFTETGRQPLAEVAYRNALNLQPSANCRVNLGKLLLAMGRYSEGWPYYESRYDPYAKVSTVPIKSPRLSYPQWQGEGLVGKSLLIWPEQGYGDAIQFVRYARLLKGRGVSRLTWVCAEPLKNLLETAEGVDEVILVGAAVPEHNYWSFPLSLPMHFRTTMETIPSRLSYLHALPTRIDSFRYRLPVNVLKVGLVWKGAPQHMNDINRSLPNLTLLAPLWTVHDVAFISLQKGQGEMEANLSEAAYPIVPLGSDIKDFADTAAIVTQLDLVICVDTAVAHIAGALGKPCWIMLPAINTDWRWHLDRSDSPWYPACVRLFRQTSDSDWAPVIAQVVEALKRFLYVAPTSPVHQR